MSDSIVGIIDLVSVAFLVSIATTYDFSSVKTNRLSRLFVQMSCLEIIALVVDSLAYLLDGRADLTVPVWIFNYLSLILPSILIVLFVANLKELLKRQGCESGNILLNIVRGLSAATIVVSIVLAAMKKLFVSSEGKFIYYSGYLVIQILQTVSILALFIVIVINLRFFHQKERFAVCFYPFLLSVSAIVGIVTGWTMSLAVSSLSLCIVNNIIQVENQSESVKKQKLLEKISTVDELTKFQNRRGYEKFLSTVGKQKNTGVIYCDLNGLKAVNDQYGHDAGDQHILKFSKILSDSFPADNIFRISGDEFIVITLNIYEDEHLVSYANFEKAVQENGQIAACGASFGFSQNLSELINLAEKNMYKDKKNYYKAHPENVR